MFKESGSFYCLVGVFPNGAIINHGKAFSFELAATENEPFAALQY